MKRIIKYIVPFLFIILAFLFKGNALKYYGTVIALISSVLYFFFGAMLGAFTTMFITFEVMNLFVIVISYAFAFIVLILVIISFFKNTGIAIAILATVVLLIDIYAQSYLSAMIILPSIFGGIFLNIGYKQISTEK